MLAGVRIIDTTRLLPGPYAGWLLASMGADVIKVEQPGRGDYIRQNWPRRAGTSTVFHIYNRGKRSIAIDLKSQEGKDAFIDLASASDAVLDGNRPGVMDRLGCGWETCRARNAKLVWCAITGFGQDGPYAGRAGHDVNYLSLAGALSGLRGHDGKPILPRVTIADMAGGGLMALAGLLGALLGAARTGQGRFVDVSMTDSVLSMQGLRIAEELAPGEQRPAGTLSGDGDDLECGVYETSDGRFISLDPYENRFKERLWSLIEQAGFGQRPSQRERGTVRSVLAHIVASQPRDAWVALLDAEDVCFAPVYELSEMQSDPNVVARGSLGDVMDPDAGSPSLSSPLRFYPGACERELGSAPALGEHSLDVLSEVGWDTERMDAATQAGAIWWPGSGAGGDSRTRGEAI